MGAHENQPIVLRGSLENPQTPVIGLALSGGGERGVAHIGVLAVLEENGIRPHVVAGSSAGAIVGALYCAGRDSQQIIEIARAINWGNIRRISWSDRRGLLHSTVIADWFAKYAGEDLTFADLEIPLTVLATDLLTGEEVQIAEGLLAPAVCASSAVPGIFTPFRAEGGRLLVDGGVVNNLPVDVVQQMGADYVIGVDVSHHASQWPTEEPKNVIDVMNLIYHILRRNTDRLHGDPDCLIAPELPNVNLSQVARYADQLYEAGRQAIAEKLPHVLAGLGLLDNRPPPSL